MPLWGVQQLLVQYLLLGAGVRAKEEVYLNQMMSLLEKDGVDIWLLLYEYLLVVTGINREKKTYLNLAAAKEREGVPLSMYRKDTVPVIVIKYNMAKTSSIV